MYYNDKLQIIYNRGADTVVKHSKYNKDGQTVEVLYYNNGTLSESVNDIIINKRPINKEEKEDIIEHHNRLMKLKKSLDELSDTNKGIGKKIRERFEAQLSRRNNKF